MGKGKLHTKQHPIKTHYNKIMEEDNKWLNGINERNLQRKVMKKVFGEIEARMGNSLRYRGGMDTRDIVAELRKTGVLTEEVTSDRDGTTVTLENGSYLLSGSCVCICEGNTLFLKGTPKEAAQTILKADSLRGSFGKIADTFLKREKAAGQINSKTAKIIVAKTLEDGGFLSYNLTGTKGGLRVEVPIASKKAVRFTLPYGEVYGKAELILSSLEILRKAEEDLSEGLFLQAYPRNGGGLPQKQVP